MKMIYFITLIFCFNNLIRLDEAINHYDIQSSDSKDLVKEDGTEPYEGEVIYSDESVTGEKTLDGYRNLNLIANSAPDCIKQIQPLESSPNYISLGPLTPDGMYYTRALLVDCVVGRIKLNEQRFLQMTKTILQMKKRLRKLSRRPSHYDVSEEDYYR